MSLTAKSKAFDVITLIARLSVSQNLGKPYLKCNLK